MNLPKAPELWGWHKFLRIPPKIGVFKSKNVAIKGVGLNDKYWKNSGLAELVEKKIVEDKFIGADENGNQEILIYYCRYCGTQLHGGPDAANETRFMGGGGGIVTNARQIHYYHKLGHCMEHVDMDELIPDTLESMEYNDTNEPIL